MIGAPQCAADVDLGVAGEIGADEQHVADLVLQPFARLHIRRRGGNRVEFGTHFLDFLVQFFQHRRGPRPVEADLGGLVLQLHRPLPFRQATGNPRQCGVVLLTLGATLEALACLPIGQLRFGILEARITEHMRMAALHLVADRRGHVGKGKRARFLGHARVEHHLQQQIAQLVLEVDHVATIDGIGDFVGFLDGVRGDGRECLPGVPRAAVNGIAQPGHDRQQIIDAAASAHVGSRASKSRSPTAMKSPLSKVSRWL